MTIDASLRNGTIIPGSDGTVIPDSQPLLAASPQLIMEPGVVRLSFKFEDGQGLTDAFGNVYVGYGGAGGSSSIVVNAVSEQVVEDDIPGVEDLDLLQFDIASELYVPRTFDEANVSRNTVRDYISVHINFPENKSYKIINNALYTQNILSATFEFEVGSGTVSLSENSVVNIGNDQSIILSGVSAGARGLIVMIFFEYDQNEATP